MLQQRFRYVPLKNEIVYAGAALSSDDAKVLQEGVTKPEDKKAFERIALKSAGKDYWPSARGETFSVPRLAVRTQGKLELLEDQFREFFWKLADCDPTLTEAEFSIADEQSRAAEVDISDKGKLETRYIAELNEQMSLLEMRGPQSASELSLWLDRQITHNDIPPNDCQLFLMKLVQRLIVKRETSVEQLVKLRFRLRDAAREKISQHRDAVNDKAFQEFLFRDLANVIEVEPSLAFDFPNSHYPANRPRFSHKMKCVAAPKRKLSFTWRCALKSIASRVCLNRTPGRRHASATEMF